jgi:hypothetical protein
MFLKGAEVPPDPGTAKSFASSERSAQGSERRSRFAPIDRAEGAPLL